MTRTPPKPDTTPRRTRLPRLLGAAALLWAAGCVTLPRDHPQHDGIPVRRLPDEVFAKPRCELVPVPPQLLRQRQDDHRVDKGDLLGVYAEGVTTKLDEPPPLRPNPSPDGTKPVVQGIPTLVQDDGTLNLPVLPELPPITLDVRGKTLAEVRQLIVKAVTVDRKLIVPGKERVAVDLIQARRVRVTVFREDAAGDPTSKKAAGCAVLLEAGRNDLLEALARTGGIPGLDAKPDVFIQRAAVDPLDPARAFVRIPVRMCHGAPVPFAEADVILNDGDAVYVQAREAEVFTTAGRLPRAEVPLPRDRDLRVLEAVSLATEASGCCPKGEKCDKFVIVLRRLGCGPQQIPIKVDLDDAARDPRENIIIVPGDTIVR